MHKKIDYTGMVFSNFIVVDEASLKVTINPNMSIRKISMWNCICICGQKFIRACSAIKLDKACRACGDKEAGKKNRSKPYLMRLIG